MASEATVAAHVAVDARWREVVEQVRTAVRTPSFSDEYITVDWVRQLMHFTVDYLADAAAAMTSSCDLDGAAPLPS